MKLTRILETTPDCDWDRFDFSDKIECFNPGSTALVDDDGWHVAHVCDKHIEVVLDFLEEPAFRGL